MKKWIIASVALSAMIITRPAFALDLTMTFTGTVNELTDPSGYLSGAAPGDPFVLVYTADFEKGFYTGGGGGFGGDNTLFGGTSETPDASAPDITISPISADLSVDGHNLTFAGDYLGSVTYVYNTFDVMFGGTGESSAAFVAQDQPSLSSLPTDDITTNLSSDIWQTFAVDVGSPLNIPIDGSHISGQTTFTYQQGTTDLSGVLTPASFASSISAAPEPGSWALMLIGLGGLGMALRAHRRMERDLDRLRSESIV